MDCPPVLALFRKARELSPRSPVSALLGLVALVDEDLARLLMSEIERIFLLFYFLWRITLPPAVQTERKPFLDACFYRLEGWHPGDEMVEIVVARSLGPPLSDLVSRSIFRAAETTLSRASPEQLEKMLAA